MPDPKTEQELRKLAERRVDARIGFRVHATVFVLVNTGLATLNFFTSPHVWWFLWPLFGWGIGLATHAWAVYGGMEGSRDDAVEKELERLRSRSGSAPSARG